MLKNLRFLFLIAISILALSCKKGDQSTSGLKEQLVDKWFYTSVYLKEYDRNEKLTKSTQLPALVNSDNITFKADDSFTTVLRQEVETNKFESVTTNGTYKVSSLSRFTLTVQGATVNCTLKSLTSAELIFTMEVAPKVTGQPYSLIEHSLHR